MASALAALIWANSPWGEGYHHFWHADVAVGVPGVITSYWDSLHKVEYVFYEDVSGNLNTLYYDTAWHSKKIANSGASLPASARSGLPPAHSSQTRMLRRLNSEPTE